MAQELITIPGFYDQWRYNSNGTVVESPHNIGTSSWFDETRPTRTRTRKPPGWLPPKAYSLSSSVYRAIQGSVKTRQSGTATYFLRVGSLAATYQGNDGTQGPLGFSPGAINRCEIKALLALKDQKVNLGVALAEAQQTANLVGDVAGRLGKAYSALRRGQFRKAARTLGVNPRQAPNHWLELQYAWKPLLADVHGSTMALVSSPRYHWVVTARGKEGERTQRKHLVINTTATVEWDYDDLRGCLVRLDYEPGNTFFSALSQAGVTNPLEVLWEKVPFSFVVDWFLPIGDWLSSLDATYGWTFKDGSCSQFSRRRLKGKVLAGQGLTFAADAHGRQNHVRLVRTVYSDSPIPFPPGFKNPVSVDHAANGLSLLSTAFGRGKR